LVSLEKRKSDLEDIELELLTRSEVSAKTLSDIAKTREALAEKLAKAEEAVDSQIAKLKSSLSVLNQDRERASSHVGQELFEHYEKLAAKQIGVGRMSGSACPVCGILLSGSNLDEIREVPFDELAYCPECSGILLKS